MINIPITSTFKKTGFKQAERQISILERSTKRLGAALAATFGARQISRLTRQSIRAFVAEDKAVQALARNLENLGIAYDVRPVEDYIRSLQYATGVADGELRPALQQLVTSTRSLAISQDLLNLALDISAGTGKSLGSVVQGLSRAYLGTNTSLTRLNIGLSKADLSTKSFNEITAELTKRFSGQAARAAQTYAGKIAILGAAANDAQEILGEKLIKSVELLLDEKTGVVALAKSFEDMATYTGNVALGLADIIKQVKTLGGLVSGGPSAEDLIQAIPILGSYLSLAAARGAQLSAKELRKQKMISRAIAKEQGMLRSRNFKIEKQTTNELTKQQKLKKAGEMFEDERISIAAALQNESLDRNEILRLELKRALINENAGQAEKLAEELRTSQRELASLSALKLANPFADWESSMARIREGMASLGLPVGSITGVQTPSLSGKSALEAYNLGARDIGVAGGAAFLDFILSGETQNPTGIAPSGNNVVLNMNISNLTGTLPDETKRQIVDAVVEASSYGLATGWFRTVGVTPA